MDGWMILALCSSAWSEPQECLLWDFCSCRGLAITCSSIGWFVSVLGTRTIYPNGRRSALQLDQDTCTFVLDALVKTGTEMLNDLVNPKRWEEQTGDIWRRPLSVRFYFWKWHTRAHQDAEQLVHAFVTSRLDYYNSFPLTPLFSFTWESGKRELVCGMED